MKEILSIIKYPYFFGSLFYKFDSEERRYDSESDNSNEEKAENDANTKNNECGDEQNESDSEEESNETDEERKSNTESKSEKREHFHEMEDLFNWDKKKKFEFISPKFLLGDVVFLKTSSQGYKKMFAACSDCYLGNWGFHGAIWQNLAMVVELDYNIIN